MELGMFGRQAIIAKNAKLIDTSTGEELLGVVYANDGTGEYRASVKTRKGRYVLNPQKTEILKRWHCNKNIKIVINQ